VIISSDLVLVLNNPPCAFLAKKKKTDMIGVEERVGEERR
jgi:hypothetical protein